MQQFKWLV